MKTITSIRILIAVIAIASFTLILKSCKKADINPPDNKSTEAARAATIQAIKARYGNVSAGIIYKVNKEAKDLFFRNTTGGMVNFRTIKPTLGSGGAENILCNYNCNNTNNPANLHLVYTLSYVQRNYIYESGDKSDLNVSWTISVPFTPLTTYNGNNSTGTLKVTDPGSTLHTYSGLSITIRTIGADPNCGANTLYEITYKATLVPDSYLGSGMLISSALSLYNNCVLVGNLVTTGDTDAPDFSLYPHLPCSRVDKVWVNPYIGPNGCTTAAGCYNVGNYPNGFTPIDNHQVEYRQVNSGSSYEWDDQTSTVYWGKNTTTNNIQATVGPYQTSDLENMISGNWLVRYRNMKTSYCGQIGSSPDADWGNHFYWVVEYWPI